MEIVFFCRGNTVIYESKKISPIVIERMSKNVSLHNTRYPLSCSVFHRILPAELSYIFLLLQRVRTLYRKTYFSFQRQLPIRRTLDA